VKSIAFSVPLREQGTEVAMMEAERLVGPLQGLYGKQKRILGFEAIKVWIQMASEGPRLNLYRRPRNRSTKRWRRAEIPITQLIKSCYAYLSPSPTRDGPTS
jgi:hypothetical protein